MMTLTLCRGAAGQNRRRCAADHLFKEFERTSIGLNPLVSGHRRRRGIDRRHGCVRAPRSSRRVAAKYSKGWRSSKTARRSPWALQMPTRSTPTGLPFKERFADPTSGLGKAYLRPLDDEEDSSVTSHRSVQSRQGSLRRRPPAKRKLGEAPSFVNDWRPRPESQTLGEIATQRL